MAIRTRHLTRAAFVGLVLVLSGGCARATPVGLPGPWVGDVAFATPEIVFIVADSDIYRSDDGGETWALSFSISLSHCSLSQRSLWAS